MPRFSDPEPLAAGPSLAGFDCGVAFLNRWLIEHALQAAAGGSARTFVMRDREQHRVIGYYALSAASITHAAATARAVKGMPRHPIPAVLLARLGVDASVQSRGVGAWLLRDAMLRMLAAAQELGIRVLLVHAIDEHARGFYEHHGFQRSPTDPLNLQLLIKDLERSVDQAAP